MQWSHNRAPIDKVDKPNDVNKLLQSVDTIVCSTLQRTQDSIALFNKLPHIESNVFNEIEVPDYKLHFLTLKPKQWLIVFRVLHILNPKSDGRFLKISKTKAISAVNNLERYLENKNSLALMGHGGLNHFIANELENRGYRLTKSHNKNANLGYRVYEK